MIIGGPTWAATEADYEHRLIGVLQKIQSGEVENALSEVRSLIRDYPKSRAGHLIYGDLLMASTAPVGQLGGRLASAGGHQATVDSLRQELRLRWGHHNGRAPAHNGLVPENLLEFGAHPLVVFVDLSRSRLYLYENSDSGPRLIADYYTGMGEKGAGKQVEGDLRTPVGVYEVTGYIPGSELPDLYGLGAFPLDYPNTMDRLLGKTGYGIWLHGTPSNTYNRAPLSSEGCLTVSNVDFGLIQDYLQPNARTPFIIADEVNWVPIDTVRLERQSVLSQIEKWRQDWESLDTDRYLSHYSPKEFRSASKDFAAWSAHKRKVNKKKQFIKVKLENIGVFKYPMPESDVVVVKFTQDYKSSNYEARVRKQQYWKKEAGQWRIIYEG